MNVAQQRRGRATTEKATATILVVPSDEDNNAEMATLPTMNNNNNIDTVEAAVLISEQAALVPQPVRVVATVRRNTCGTGPFDKYWLNMDCCGLVCAVITYFLHAYGVYAVNWVLLPPWMSVTTDTGRSLSFFGMFHTLAFLFVSFMAVASHFQAMTTDPGAVPPDAKPLHNNSLVQQEMQSLMDPLPSPPVKRLCRRCKTFKPQRAHHCSVCQRCIIKMDHHCPYVTTTTATTLC